MEKNWKWITTTTDENDAWTIINILMREAMDEIAPEKEIRIKSRTDPWINNELLHQIENRDKIQSLVQSHLDYAIS